MGGKRRQAAALLIFAMLLTPALALILTARGGVVEASPDTFGYETPGTDGWQDVEDRITGSWFTPSSSDTVTSITAYVKAPGGPPKYKFGIHDKSDNSLVGYTEEAIGPPTDGWLTLDIVSGGSVTEGEDYWLEVWGEGANQAVAYDTEVGKGGYDEETYGTWPDPWDPTPEDKKYSIYATYGVPPVYPTQPTLYLPSDGDSLIDNTPYFEWTLSENAENYRLLVDNDDDFSSPQENRIFTTENYYFPALENSFPDENYSWKVTAINENGENASSTWTFVISPAWITPLSVENMCGQETGYENTKAIDDDIESYWTHNAVCAHWVIFDMENSYAIQKIRLYQDTTDSAKRWGITLGLTVYVSDDEDDWGDSVWDGVLDAAGWQESGEFSFKAGRYIKLVSKSTGVIQRMYEFVAHIRTAPSKPTLYRPVDGSTINGYNQKFTWTIGEGADYHLLQVDNDNDFSSTEFRILLGSSDNSYTLTTSLPNDNYSWRVVAMGSVDNISDVWTFLVDNTFMGYNRIGVSAGSIINCIAGSKFSSAIDGQVDNITAYIDVLYVGCESLVKCAIYDENLNLVSQTENLTISSDGWNTFIFSSPPCLSANENYWFFGWENGTGASIKFDSGDENQGLTWDQSYGDNFPDTIRPPDTYYGFKFSIYTNVVPSMPPVLPTQPVLSSPSDGENITTTETPQFTWSQSENENYYRLLVDTSPPDWKNLIVWATTTDNFYQVSTELSDDNYSWKVYAVNDNGRTESDTWTFLISADAHVITENATDVGSTTATLNATITTYGKYDNVEGRFDYRPYKSDVWGENWVLSDYYYDVPTNPATTNDWGNRTPVIYIAASDSSAEDKAAADNVCDGENDEVEIQWAINNLTSGGKVYLFDGTYYLSGFEPPITRFIAIHDDISLIGESKENTILKDNGSSSPVRMLHLTGSNVLVENITVIGSGRSWDKEESGFHIQAHGGGEAKNVVVRNVRAENLAAIGIYIEQSVSGAPENVWIINNEVEETGCRSICPAGAYSCYVDNNAITNCGLGTATKYGAMQSLSFFGTQGGAIVNNTVENSGGAGIYVTSYPPLPGTPSKNIVVQANLVVNSGRETDKNAGIELSGTSIFITENITIRGNKLVENREEIENQYYGILFANAYVENCIVDNNNLVQVWEPLITAGTGHTIENNVGLYFETVWNTIVKPTSAFSENIENLERNWKHQFRALIKTFDNESEKGDTLTIQLIAVPEINTVHMPPIVNIDENFDVYVEVIHSENLVRINEVWLKIYKNTKSQEDNDNTKNHYTFKWVRGENFSEVGPDNTSPYGHLDIENSLAGQDNLMIDNFVFWVRLETDAERGDWNVWVKAIDNENAQDNQEFVNKFSVMNVAPNHPTSLWCEGQTNPTQITDLTPEFSAIGIDNDNDQMTYYALQVDNDSNFGSVFWDNTKTSITAFDNGTRCENITYAGSSLARGITYYWRIKFWDNNDVEGGWSTEEATFKIMQYPTQPQLYLPSDGSTITDNTPTFEWTVGEHASYHRLLVDNDNDFSSPNENRPIPPPADNVYTIADENALPDDNYSWKVIAINDVGENESDVWTFIVSSTANVAPNSPTSLLCEGAENPTKTTVWPYFSAICTDNNDKDTLTHAAIQVDNDSNFSSLLWDSEKMDIGSFTEGDRSPDINYFGSSPIRGITYYWRIKFWDSGGAEGAWSTETATFKPNQLPTQPTGWTNLGMNVIDHTPTIAWTKGTDADGDTVTTYVYVGTTSAPTTVETSTTGTTADLGSAVPLSDGATYYYRLRSSDGYEWSAYTSSDQFRMNSKPTVSPAVTPTNPLTTEDLICAPNEYDAEGDVVTFDYQWYENGTPISGQISSVLDSSQTKIGSKYKCRVTPNDGYEYGSTEDSNEVTVRLVNTAPVTSDPKCEGLTNPTAVERSTPTFSWTYSDADGDPQSHWQICVGTTSGASDMWDSGVQSGAFTSDVYGGSTLADETTYYWQVRAKDGYDWSEWATGTFKTAFVAEPTKGRYLLIHASADASVFEEWPTLNFGSGDRLYCSLSTTTLGLTHTYLKFDLRGLENYRVLKVELGLIAELSTDVPTVEIWTAGNDWTEMGITWNNKPSLVEQVTTMEWNEGDDLEKYKKYYADVTNAVEYAIAHDQFEITFVLVPQGLAYRWATFFSREAGEFHTLDVLYELRAPLIPAVAVAFMFTLSLVGIFTWLYIKIRGVHDLSTAGWAIACVFIALLSLIITWGISSVFLTS